MMLLFVFSIRFFQAGRQQEAAPVITGGALFFLHLLLKPDLCLSAGASTTRAPLLCLPASSGSVASSHSLVGLQCPSHAIWIFSLGSHVCGPHSVFQVVAGAVRWFLAAAYCSGVPRDSMWSTRTFSGDSNLPRRQICDLVFSVLVFRCFSVVFASLSVKFSDIIGLLMA
jgi:hypothetical protein